MMKSPERLVAAQAKPVPRWKRYGVDSLLALGGVAVGITYTVGSLIGRHGR